MALNTPKLDKAVEDFKKVCGAHTQLYQYGQFYVSRRTVDDLFHQIESDLKSNTRLARLPGQPKDAITFFFNQLSTKPENVNVAALLAKLDELESNGDMALNRILLKPTQGDRANAQADFNALWTRTDFPPAPLYSSSRPTLFKARAARQIELDRCWQVLRAFASMHAKARGKGPPPNADRLSDYLLGGALLNNVAANRQELVYANKPSLAAGVAKMRTLVDEKNGDGCYVHCGVLSGATHNQPKFPEPEHHILVFAWDKVNGQDAFLFWDPDATRSDIVSTRKDPNDAKTGWGPGFGLLFGRDGRLCTGVDDADLAAIDTDPKSPTWGDHTSEPKRHCYQVYTVQSLPLPAAVKVHMKVLSAPAHSSIDDMLDKAVWLYAAHGVELHEASREVIDAGSDLDRYQTLFVGDGESGPSDEVTALHKALRDRREEFGVEPSASDAVVAFVGDLVPAARGLALSPPGQPGIVLSAAKAGDWTLAHEIGRLAGLEIVAEPGRLMSASTAGLDNPQLTDEETQTVLDNPLAQA